MTIDELREKVKKMNLGRRAAMILDSTDDLEVQKELAKEFGIGRSTLGNVIRVKKDRNDLFLMVRHGHLTVGRAFRYMQENRSAPSRGELNRHTRGWTPHQDSPRYRELAEARKRKLIQGISELSGMSRAIEMMDVDVIGSVMDKEETVLWATKAEQCSTTLRHLAARIRGMNHARKSHGNGTSASRSTGSPPVRSEGVEPGVPAASGEETGS